MSKPDYVRGFLDQPICIGDKVAYPTWCAGMGCGVVVDFVPYSYYVFDSNWNKIICVSNDVFNAVIEIDVMYYSSFDHESQKPIYKTYKRRFESRRTRYLVKI